MVVVAVLCGAVTHAATVTETFDGATISSTGESESVVTGDLADGWEFYESNLGKIVITNNHLRITDTTGADHTKVGNADLTTVSYAIEPGDRFRASLTLRETRLDDAYPVIGIALTDNSGGVSARLADDSNLVMLKYQRVTASDGKFSVSHKVSAETVYDNGSGGANNDWPINDTLIMELYWTNSTTMLASLYDANTNQLGSTATINVTGLPAAMYMAFISSSGITEFDNVEITTVDGAAAQNVVESFDGATGGGGDESIITGDLAGGWEFYTGTAGVIATQVNNKVEMGMSPPDGNNDLTTVSYKIEPGDTVRVTAKKLERSTYPAMGLALTDNAGGLTKRLYDENVACWLTYNYTSGNYGIRAGHNPSSNGAFIYTPGGDFWDANASYVFEIEWASSTNFNFTFLDSSLTELATTNMAVTWSASELYICLMGSNARTLFDDVSVSEQPKGMFFIIR